MKLVGNGIEFAENELEGSEGSTTGEMIEEYSSESQRLIAEGLSFAKFISTDRMARKFVRREGFPKILSHLRLVEDDHRIGSERCVKHIRLSSGLGAYLFSSSRNPNDIIAHNLKQGLRSEKLIETEEKKVLSLDYISRRYGDGFQNQLNNHFSDFVGNGEELVAYEYFALVPGFDELKKTFPIYDKNDFCVYLADLTRDDGNMFTKATNRQSVYFRDLLKTSLEGLKR